LKQSPRYNDGTLYVYGLVSSIILGFISYSPYGLFPKLLAIGSSILAFTLLWDVLLNKNMKSLYILPFITLNWLYFQSPFLLREKTYYYNRIIQEEYIDEIAIYCCLSIICMFLGYVYFLNKRTNPLTSSRLRFKKEVIKNVVYFFIFLSVVFRVGEVISPNLISALSNLIQLLPYSSTIAFGFYVMIVLNRKRTFELSVLDIIVLIFIGSEFLIRLSTTLFSEVAILFAGPLLVYWREKGKLPIVQIMIALLVMIPLYETRKYFRLHSEEVKDFSGGDLSKGRLVLENAYELKNQKDFNALQQQQQSEAFNRFENLSFISHVVLMHKKGIKPFLNGETFYWLPLVPVPRVIFPAKPKNVMSTDVATEYGLRGEVSIASINFPMLVEGYINFGFKGMVLMSLLFGIAYKWFASKFGFGVGDLNLIIVMNSVKQFTHAEGNITLVFGALIQVYLFWYVVVWFFKLNENNKLFYVEKSTDSI